MVYLLIGLIVYLIIDSVIANYMTMVAYKKGYDDSVHAFALSFWLGIAGWLYVVALPDLIARDNQEKIIKLLVNGTISDSNNNDLPEL